jgi:signal transduction histidine kinase
MHEQAKRAQQELQRRLVNAQEEERRRISRGLHDEVGQQMTGLMLALKALEVSLVDESRQAAEKLREVRGTAEGIGREIHQLAMQLRPAALDSLGLSRALAGYLEYWRSRSSVEVDFVSTGISEPRLPSVIETSVYRIVQEALNNVFKHADATSVSVTIERIGESVVAIVEDDGSGFEPPIETEIDFSRIGIASMRERAAVVGGTLTIESSPSGTTIRLEIPLHLA